MGDKKKWNEYGRNVLFGATAYFDLIISIITFAAAIFYLIKGIKLNYPKYGMSAVLFTLSSLAFLYQFFKQCKVNPLVFRAICFLLAGIVFFCSGVLVSALFYLVSIALIIAAILTLSKCKNSANVEGQQHMGAPLFSITIILFLGLV